MVRHGWRATTRYQCAILKNSKKKKKKKRREIKTENSIRKLSDEQIKEMNETAKGLERLEGCIFIYLFIRWC